MSKTYQGQGQWLLRDDDGRTVAAGLPYHAANRAISRARAAERKGLLDGREARRIALEEATNIRRLLCLAAEYTAEGRV